MTKLNEIEKTRESAIYQSYLSNAFLDKICEIMNKKNISNTRLATHMGVSKSEISRLLSDDRNLTVKMLARIFHALNEKIEIMTAAEISSIKIERSLYAIMGDRPHIVQRSHARYVFHQKMLSFMKNDMRIEYGKRIKSAG